MLKNEVVQNCSETYQLESARQYDPNVVNGTQIRRRMQKIFSFKDLSISIKNAKIDFMENFIKKRIFWEYSMEYSAEYSVEYSTKYSQNILWNILFLIKIYIFFSKVKFWPFFH